MLKSHEIIHYISQLKTHTLQYIKTGMVAHFKV